MLFCPTQDTLCLSFPSVWPTAAHTSGVCSDGPPLLAFPQHPPLWYTGDTCHYSSLHLVSIFPAMLSAPRGQIWGLSNSQSLLQCLTCCRHPIIMCWIEENWIEWPVSARGHFWTIISKNSVHPQRTEICILRKIKRMCWGSKGESPRWVHKCLRRWQHHWWYLCGQCRWMTLFWGEVLLPTTMSKASPRSQSTPHYSSLICSFTFRYFFLIFPTEKGLCLFLCGPVLDTMLGVCQMRHEQCSSFLWRGSLGAQPQFCRWLGSAFLSHPLLHTGEAHHCTPRLTGQSGDWCCCYSWPLGSPEAH